MKYVGPRGIFFGTDAERSAYVQADVGQWWYATDTNKFWYWIGAQWTQLRARDIDATASWGASGKKLFNYVSTSPPYDLYSTHAVNLITDSDFVATIAALPGGANLTYNAPTSGHENNIVPSAATNLAKLVLHNTTRSNSGLISNVNIATNTITLTANVPADWQVGDAITARSQTNATVVFAPAYFFDFDISENFGPTLTSLLDFVWWRDTAAASRQFVLHPYCAYSGGAALSLYTQVANIGISLIIPLAIYSQRFTMLWQPSGVTGRIISRVTGYFEEAAT